MKHTHVISCPSPNVPCDVCATPNDTSATQRCHAPKNVKLHLGSVHLPTSTVQGSNKAQCDNIHNYHQLSHDPELPVISSCFSYLKLYIPPVTSLGFPHNFASRALATCWTALKFNAHKSKHDKLWQVDFVYLWRNFCQRNGEAKTSTQFHKCMAWSRMIRQVPSMNICLKQRNRHAMHSLQHPQFDKLMPFDNFLKSWH